MTIPLLNMVDLAADHVGPLRPQSGRIGMLGSPAVRKIGLFDTALARHGLSTLWPEDDGAMLSAIRSIKTDGATAASRETLRMASAELLQKGADVQFIACSEFSIIADSVAEGAKAIDTLDILVRAIVDFVDSA